ncbi:MAG: AsmA family protein [Tepidisphaeraceae bacterium]
MKKLKWVILALLIAVIVAGTAVVMSLDGIVRRTIETQATDSLDLKTTLASASVSLLGGQLRLGELNIASPQGYKAPEMLSLEGTGIKVSLGELRAAPVRVSSITLDKPRLVIEANGTKLNFQALTEKPSKTPSTGETLKLIINELNVNAAQVALRPGLSGIPGLKDEYAITLPSVSLKDIGNADGNQNGAALREVVMQVITALAAKAAESDQLPPELKNLLSLNVDAVAKQLGAEFNKQINQQVGNVSKDLGKSVEGGLKDLLGDKKKDPSKGK